MVSDRLMTTAQGLSILSPLSDASAEAEQTQNEVHTVAETKLKRERSKKLDASKRGSSHPMDLETQVKERFVNQDVSTVKNESRFFHNL